MPAKIPQHVREEQLNALPGIKFIKWLDGYGGSRSKAVMKCNSGHEWSAAVTHLLNSGSACPKCSYESRAINRRTDIRGLTETLSRLPNLSFVGWVDGYRNKSSKVVMRCDSGHT